MINDYNAVYGRAYTHSNYRMGGKRLALFENFFRKLMDEDPSIESFCDVATGRGEAIDYVLSKFGISACGYELPSVAHLHTAVTEIQDISTLPAHDGEFDVVACLDVLEHLEELDVLPALTELDRVTGKYLMISTAWFESTGYGETFHLTIKPPEWWSEQITSLGHRSHSELLDQHGKIGWWIIAKD